MFNLRFFLSEWNVNKAESLEAALAKLGIQPEGNGL